jgi:hypothetical protein
LAENGNIFRDGESELDFLVHGVATSGVYIVPPEAIEIITPEL